MKRAALTVLSIMAAVPGAAWAQARTFNTDLQVKPEQTDLTPGQPAFQRSRGSAPTQSEVSDFWRVIQRGEADAAARTLQGLRDKYPGWIAPVDFTRAVLQLDIDRAASRRDLAGLMALRTQHPEMFDCTAIKNAQVLADALKGADKTAEAIEIYLTLGQDCDVEDDRATALIAALTLAGPREIQTVLERIGFMTSLSPALRKTLGVPMVTARLRLLLLGSGPAQAQMRARLESDITLAQDPEQATALGNFDLSNGNAAAALTWFDRALDWNGGLPALEGKIAALPMLGRVDEARALAARAGLSESALAGGYRVQALDSAKTGDVAAAFRNAEAAAKSGVGAVWEDLGWALLDRQRPADAVRAFRTAPKTENARYGHILASNRQDLGWTGVAELCAPEARSARITQVCGDVLETAAKAVYDAEQWAAARDLRAQGLKIGLRRAALDEFAGWSAFRLNDAPAAVEVLEPLYLNGADVAAGLFAALGALGQPEKAAELFKSNSHRPADQAFVAEAFNARAVARTKAGDVDGALKDAQTAGTFDPTRFETFGWAMLDAGQPKAALDAFADAPMTENARYGRLLALQRTDAPWDEALKACAPGTSERLDQLCAGIAATAANAAYQKESWTDVLNIYDTTKTAKVAVTDIQPLAGWSALRTSDPNRAIELFSPAYDAGAEVASGLVAAYRDAGRMAELDARLKSDTGKLATVFDAEIAGPLMAEEKYAQLYHLSPERFPQFAGLDQPTFSVSTFARGKKGDAGQDQLDAAALSAQGRYPLQDGELVVAADRRKVRIGTASPGDAVGSAGATVIAGRSRDTLVTPAVRWRHDADPWTVTAELGASPLGGVIDGKPVGGLDVQHASGDLILGAGLLAEARQDSILSASGLRDPFGASVWGRVIERGAALRAIYMLPGDWSLSGSVGASRLTGRVVASNARVQTRLGVSRQWTTDDLDYIRLGAFHSWQSFDRNLSFFTLGHGGYFSPQNQNSFGSNLDLRSRAGRPWLFDGQFSLAWTAQRESLEQRFPLVPDGQLVGGSSSDGFSFESLLRASRLVNESFRLGAYARASLAPNYRDYAGGVTLSYSLGPRAGSVPVDLPAFVDRSNR
jgi:tetratricopeptide (TPR) repeat protein